MPATKPVAPTPGIWMMVIRLTLVCLTLGTMLFVSSCQKASAPASSGSSSQPSASQPATNSAPATSSPAAAPQAANSKPPIASAEYSANPALRCDLIEVKRVSGGAVIVKWRLVNTETTQSAGLVAGSQPKPIYYDFDWKDIYFVDPAENKKYGFLTDSENNRILDVYYGSMAAGEQRSNWAKFPAPPASSTKISVSIPKFAPFEDVPVS